MERLSSFHSISGGSNQGNISEVADFELLNEMLRPSLSDFSSNWILSDVALHIESQAKSDMAMHYLTKLLKEHPSWADTNIEYSAVCTHNKADIHQYHVLLKSFENKLRAWLACLEQKFSLVSHHLINKVFKFINLYISINMLYVMHPNYNNHENNNQSFFFVKYRW